MERKKLSDIAFFVQCLGVFLFLPPVLEAWDRGTADGGLPLLPFYLFAVWFFLIVAVFCLSRLLHNDESSEDVSETSSGGDGLKAE